MQSSHGTWARLIQSPSDIVTTHQATRDGFLQQALQKTEKATPYVQRAQELYVALQAVKDVDKLLDLPQFREGLIAAAGFSEKATNHLSDEELNNALRQVFRELYTRCQTDFNAKGEEQIRFAFHQEILYRYLLTNGDSLGGEMRNVTGAMASQKLATTLLNALQGQNVQVKQSASGKVQRISWLGRILLFDVKPTLLVNNKRVPLNNIDIILLNTANQQMTGKQPQEDPTRYLACGELKGGIDPAGADEHWKTARSALDRIRDVFVKECQMACPHLFFVGAAITPVMAGEVYQRLTRQELSFVANLTVSDQLEAIAQWLTRL